MSQGCSVRSEVKADCRVRTAGDCVEKVLIERMGLNLKPTRTWRDEHGYTIILPQEVVVLHDLLHCVLGEYNIYAMNWYNRDHLDF